MFLGYETNHIGSTYGMLNLCTKRIVLSREIIKLNKNHSEYLSKCKLAKADIYTLQDEDHSDKWAQVKIDPVNIEDVKTDPCLLYILNNIVDDIAIVYLYGILEIGYKPVFLYMVEWIKK